jgi:hypothetical protein
MCVSVRPKNVCYVFFCLEANFQLMETDRQQKIWKVVE